jgi:hypothetical protein
MAAIFRCGGAKSNPRPEFGFEVANEGSVAYGLLTMNRCRLQCTRTSAFDDQDANLNRRMQGVA